jgi:hypothetical protein
MCVAQKNAPTSGAAIRASEQSPSAGITQIRFQGSVPAVADEAESPRPGHPLSLAPQAPLKVWCQQTYLNVQRYYTTLPTI